MGNRDEKFGPARVATVTGNNQDLANRRPDVPTGEVQVSKPRIHVKQGQCEMIKTRGVRQELGLFLTSI